MDITATTMAKTDQINAVDLQGRTMTATITGVDVDPNRDQPVWISLKETKLYFRPNLTMRRVLKQVWSKETDEWIGRRITLFCDEHVNFGKDRTGGVRISHMSHIPESVTVPVIAKRGKVVSYTVKPLAVEAAKPAANEITPRDLKAAHDAAARGTEAFRDWCKANPIWKQIDAGTLQILHATRKAADAADDPAPVDPVAAMTPDQIESAMAQAAQEFLAKGDE
jgi:hypothetical protein